VVPAARGGGTCARRAKLELDSDIGTRALDELFGLEVGGHVAV